VLAPRGIPRQGQDVIKSFLFLGQLGEFVVIVGYACHSQPHKRHISERSSSIAKPASCGIAASSPNSRGSLAVLHFSLDVLASPSPARKFASTSGPKMPSSISNTATE
jgi:hypothetical protein